MKQRYRHGLIVGKFAPLHYGHEYLIANAQMVCDELCLLSWSHPELAGCEAAKRRSWLQARFPRCRTLVLSLDDWRNLRRAGWPALPRDDASATEQRRFTAFLCRHVLKIVPDVVFTGEAYGAGFARSLGAQLGCDVAHVRIDRSHCAISGRAIRRSPHAQRHLLSREVYASFVRRVCILGGESSGKSTLADALARALGSVSVPEYGRELWLARGGDLSRTDLRLIAREQIRREDIAAYSATTWLVCDTSPLTTLGYSYWMHGAPDRVVAALAKRRYDATLLCVPDFGFHQDGTRRSADFSLQQHRWYEAQLAHRGIAHQLCSGPLEHRVATALNALALVGNGH